MIKNSDKKTTPMQRIVIVAIAVVMLGSVFAMYATSALSAENNSKQSQEKSEMEARFEELYADYMNQLNEQAQRLSSKHFDEFSSYKSRVKSFNAADVEELKTKDLKIGSGAEVSSEDFVDYSAYYIGWLSDGTVFDSSFDDFDNPTSLNNPLEGMTGLIKGWIEGIQGMKIGGVREITIPSTLGYGEQESDLIPANSSLKFVVMLIEHDSVQPSEELEELYSSLYGY